MTNRSARWRSEKRFDRRTNRVAIYKEVTFYLRVNIQFSSVSGLMVMRLEHAGKG